MPRKAQGWITFQSSEEERQILEQICRQTQRTKTEVLREMLRNLGQAESPAEPDESELEINLESAFEADGPGFPPMQLSARNVLRAQVKQVRKDRVNAEITLIIAPGIELVSIITRASADKLQLKQGKTVFAVIKSNNVMLAGV